MPAQSGLRVDNSSYCTTPSGHNDQLVNVKVGCLHINPATARGRRLYMLQMLVLAFVPHAALILQNCSIMAQLSTTLESSLYLHTDVNSGLVAGDVMADFQDERLLAANYLTVARPVNRSDLQRGFTTTNANLAEIPSSLISEQYMIALYHFRESVLYIKNLNMGDSLRQMSVYGDINTILLLYATKNWRSTTSALCRQLSACYELLKSIEEFSLALMSATFLVAPDGPKGLEGLQRHQVAVYEHLTSTLQYLEAEGMDPEVVLVNGVMTFLGGAAPLRLNRSDEERYFASARACLQDLRLVKARLWIAVQEAVKQEVWVSRRTLAIGVVILTMVLACSPVLILLLRHTVNTIQTFTQSIELSTQQLEAEKQKSDLLLSRMLPLPVLRRLRAERTVPAESFDAVTIFFSDIVGFTNISAQSTPMEVINMLNMLYRLFDERIAQYNVYKVETIGDAYMVVSGLPKRNGNRHASEIADMSLSLMRILDGAKVPHQPDEPLRVRAGVNTGPCVAGVVGTTMPRYCLFGDTINTASRMESTGEAMKIHISCTTKKALDEIGGYQTESRGQVDVAGKGTMETFWLVGKPGARADPESPRCMRLHDYQNQNLLELLIR